MNTRKQNQRMQLNLKDLSYSFSLEVIKFVDSLPQDRIFIPIGDQILRSSTSVGANIVEAKAARSEKEYVKYSEIALKSSHKTEYWLSLVADSYENLRKPAKRLIDEVKGIRSLLEVEPLSQGIISDKLKLKN